LHLQQGLHPGTAHVYVRYSRITCVCIWCMLLCEHGALGPVRSYTSTVVNHLPLHAERASAAVIYSGALENMQQSCTALGLAASACTC
jgi:hypothetical protein